MTTKNYSSKKEQDEVRHNETLNRRPTGSKAKKRIEKHRLDHSNPGGIISEYFRNKNAKV